MAVVSDGCGSFLTSTDFAASVIQDDLLGLGAVEFWTGLAGGQSMHGPVL